MLRRLSWILESEGSCHVAGFDVLCGSHLHARIYGDDEEVNVTSRRSCHDWTAIHPAPLVRDGRPTASETTSYNKLGMMTIYGAGHAGGRYRGRTRPTLDE